MSWKIGIEYFLLGLVVGSILTYAYLDHNYKDFTRPNEELSSKLEFCDISAEKATFYMETGQNYTTFFINAREYFQCVQKAYNFTNS